MGTQRLVIRSGSKIQRFSLSAEETGKDTRSTITENLTLRQTHCLEGEDAKAVEREVGVTFLVAFSSGLSHCMCCA